jgi:hypothetical protein
MFTPSFIRMGEHPGDNFTPRGKNSLRGDNFIPGGQSLRLGAKLRLDGRDTNDELRYLLYGQRYPVSQWKKINFWGKNQFFWKKSFFGKNQFFGKKSIFGGKIKIELFSGVFFPVILLLFLLNWGSRLGSFLKS